MAHGTPIHINACKIISIAPRKAKQIVAIITFIFSNIFYLLLKLIGRKAYCPALLLRLMALLKETDC